MSDPLEIDQVDFAARLAADAYFSDITVLSQFQGVTENDISRALGTLTKKDGKAGACAIVLMPDLKPDGANTPGPLYVIHAVVQVVERPLVNRGATGTGKSAESIGQRVRQLLHHFNNGLGTTYNFDGMEPIPRGVGEISYGVAFTRKAGDDDLIKVRTPKITASAALAPATITITCATSGAVIHYTTDGTPPSPNNPTALPYSAPFNQATAATIRAAATSTDLVQSNTTQLKLSSS